MLRAMHFGFGEIILILVVVLLLFGGTKIPQLGEALGKGIRNFRKSTTEDDSIDVTPEKQPKLQGASASAPVAQQATPVAEKKKA